MVNKSVFVLTFSCLLAFALFPQKSIAQTANPRSGDIYYYQRQTKKGDYSEWIAVLFVDGGIKAMSAYYDSYSGRGTNYNDFKKKVSRDISNQVKIPLLDSRGSKIVYKKGDKDDYCTYTFSKSFNSLENEYYYYDYLDDDVDEGRGTYERVQ